MRCGGGSKSNEVLNRGWQEEGGGKDTPPPSRVVFDSVQGPPQLKAHLTVHVAL